MGYSKNYNVLGGGYEYYNTIPYPRNPFPKFTNITILIICFWYFYTKLCRDNCHNNPIKFVQQYRECEINLHKERFKLFSSNLLFLQKKLRALVQH